MTEEKAQPTVAELEAKAQRLAGQVDVDSKAETTANDAFARAVKSGDVDKALELADARTAAKATAAKSVSQHKSAAGAVASAKHAANADKIATIHNAIRDGKLNVPAAFEQLETFGVKRITVERSEETGNLLINSVGPSAPKRTRSGGGGNGRGQPVTVDGTVYDSASAALKAFFPDSGPLNRDSILSKITNAGHEVS